MNQNKIKSPLFGGESTVIMVIYKIMIKDISFNIKLYSKCNSLIDI